MRKLTLAILAAGVASIAGPSIAADMPYYPPIIEVPDVDYGYQGSFYLRGSAGWFGHHAKEVHHPTATPPVFGFDTWGYGYSYGVGAGYETGSGLRVDLTIDRIASEGMSADTTGIGGLWPGVHRLSLRSTVALANAYFDVGFGDGYGAAGGPFAYAGAGVGIAYNDVITTGPGPADVRGGNTSFAAAGMAGFGYDFGQVVADVGYRALYINRIENATAPAPYAIDNNWIHEIRGTVRYRFN